jgi:DNA-directed RNA polymerase specialized sigma24 family protein
MTKSELSESGPLSRRFRQALAGLSPLQREIIGAGLTGDDESSDAEIADRHGTSASTVRVERILARRRLHDLLIDPLNPER